MVENIQTHGDRMKRLILSCGIKIWRRDPATVSARSIGRMLGKTHSAVLYHFGTADQLHRAIAAEAVRIGDTVIVPQLITANHSAVASLSALEKGRYLADYR